MKMFSKKTSIIQFFPKKIRLLGGGQLIRPFKWTIDRERDFVLICVGSNGPEGMPDRFVFQWQGELGAVTAKQTYDVIEPFKDGRPGYLVDYFWTIDIIVLPASLSDQREAVKRLLDEAFTVYGNYYGSGNPRSITVVWDECAVGVGESLYAKL